MFLLIYALGLEAAKTTKNTLFRATVHESTKCQLAISPDKPRKHKEVSLVLGSILGSYLLFDALHEAYCSQLHYTVSKICSRKADQLAMINIGTLNGYS